MCSAQLRLQRAAAFASAALDAAQRPGKEGSQPGQQRPAGSVTRGKELRGPQPRPTAAAKQECEALLEMPTWMNE